MLTEQELQNLDIGIASSMLEGFEPNDEFMQLVADVKKGDLTPEQAIQLTLKQFSADKQNAA